jgi:enoyl-[acyl-carrier protein] reductase I
VTQEDVGNTALFLASDWGKMITGEVIHVDSGFNILGMTISDEEIAKIEGGE